jgi:hypothetical protein
MKVELMWVAVSQHSPTLSIMPTKPLIVRFD